MKAKLKNIELSIIIPLYNEEKRFPCNFKIIDKFFQGLGISKEYILVDDGSSDKTFGIIKIQKSRSSISVLQNEKNLGKGAAIKLGVLKASGKNIFFTDADLSTPITEFEKLYKHLKNYDLVIGSRRLKDSEIEISQPFHRIFLGKIFYLFFSIFFTNKVKDTNCGFKCYRGSIAKKIYSNVKNSRWGFDAEAIFIADKMNLRIKEVPIRWLNDSHSRVSSFKAILSTLKELVKIKINDLTGKYDL